VFAWEFRKTGTDGGKLPLRRSFSLEPLARDGESEDVAQIAQMRGM